MDSESPSTLESKYVIFVRQIDGETSFRQRWPEEQDRIVVGRNDSCDVVVQDENVSREHLSIEDETEDVFLVRDLDSTNGMLFEGNQVEEQQLEFDQEIQFSNYRLKVCDLDWLELEEEESE